MYTASPCANPPCVATRRASLYIARCVSSAHIPRLVYTTPRKLPKPESLEGRVAVLDIAFAADGMGTPFEETTGRFIAALGSRLAAWVDHHDHDRQAEYARDPRFTLATKAQHGACPEMVTPEVVHAAGPIDTLVTHVDLDGLDAAAKWIRGGKEPYPGADDDARAVDTRIGTPGPVAELIDNALRYGGAGEITLSARATDAVVFLAVCDEGPGIPEDERGRIFEPFVRGRAGRAAGDGSGLGLSIVARAAEILGGSLELAAGPGGIGLAASVTVPTNPSRLA